ncbi:MAG: cephalosporin hydroxylase family protein [Arenimonas sp.]
MNPHDQFKQEVSENISGLEQDKDIQALSRTWMHDIAKHKYPYNFTWLGRPIIQVPQDITALQELIWQIKPDLIIETGIAHGGSLILSASMLSLLDYCDAVNSGSVLDPKASGRHVLGIDIDIRAHNRAAIEAHPMAHKIRMLQGSSISQDIIDQVKTIAATYKKILVILDSNHTQEHVLAELEAYASLVSSGSYCIVFDTLIEDMPDEMFGNRPWGKGDNPKTAVWEYLRRLNSTARTAADGLPLTFEIDKTIQSKLLLTVAPDGYLKRIS